MTHLGGQMLDLRQDPGGPKPKPGDDGDDDGPRPAPPEPM